ncbi:DUF3105 domain-containing protein [Candidatus Microgenomates bacterium]|nr:DUF3105 domain-containing protein [Candidatus Microgenomates bacterium]
MRKIKKWILWGGVGVVIIAGLWWLAREATKPVPGETLGEKVADMGANHVTDISGVTYNSDPPTSGPHFGIWAKKGVYDRVISDGHLIHSLEHGYVAVSYNCDKLVPSAYSEGASFAYYLVPSVLAHESDEPHEEATVSGTATDSARPLTRMNTSGMSFFTPSNPPASEVTLSENFQSEGCKKLVNDLWETVKGWQRVIVVPRPNMDSPITLTAWTRILKLDSYDSQKIKEFVEAFHNRGPEKTTE